MLGFSVGMEAFDELLLINVPWRQEFSGVLRIGLKPPASGFQSYFYSSLKASLLYSTIDKTSPFEDNELLFWVRDVLCQHSEVVLWNLLSI